MIDCFALCSRSTWHRKNLQQRKAGHKLASAETDTRKNQNLIPNYSKAFWSCAWCLLFLLQAHLWRDRQVDDEGKGHGSHSHLVECKHELRIWSSILLISVCKCISDPGFHLEFDQVGRFVVGCPILRHMWLDRHFLMKALKKTRCAQETRGRSC